MLKPEFTGQFKRDYKLAVRGFNPEKLEEVVSLLYAAGLHCRQHIRITRL